MHNRPARGLTEAVAHGGVRQIKSERVIEHWGCGPFSSIREGSQARSIYQDVE
jgi:hypothetical protein